MSDDQPLRLEDAPDSPWRTLAAQMVYRNPWMTVTEYQVIRPDGAPGIYGVVDPGDSVSVVALDDEEQVWVVEDFVYTIQMRCWALPTGAAERGEEPLLAAQRELAEETGLSATRWESLGAFYLSPGIVLQRSYLYLARGLTLGAPQREGSEAHMTTRRMPLRDAYSASLRGETPAGATALGLWLAWTRLRGDAPPPTA